MIEIKSRLICFIIVAVITAVASDLRAQSTIDVDVSNTLGTLSNMAGGVNFAGGETAMQRFTDEVGTKIYRFGIGLYGVEKDGDSYTNFPWEDDHMALADMLTLIDYYNQARDKGARILLMIYGVPLWLSTSGDQRVVTGKVPNYAKYPPTDYAEWSRVVSAAITELKNMGMEIDCYGIFIEVSTSFSWYAQSMPCLIDEEVVLYCEDNELGHKTAQVMRNYFRIYKYTYLGIKDADPDAKIGGLSMIPNLDALTWTRFFTKFLKNNNLPLDTYLWHFFGDDLLPMYHRHIQHLYPLTVEDVRDFYEGSLFRQGFNSEKREVIINDYYHYLKSLENQNIMAIRHPYSFLSYQLKKILNEEGFGESELVFDAWHVSTKQDIRHDTHYAASFITRGLIDITDADTKNQTLFYLSHYSTVAGGYGGNFALFTLDGNNIPKASYNAFRLFAMLGDGVDRISASSSDGEIYSIATQGENNIHMLATWYRRDNEPEYDLNKYLTITIENIPFERYNYKIYLIDSNYANSFINPESVELEIVYEGEALGNFRKAINLDIYSVIMVKIEALQ